MGDSVHQGRQDGFRGGSPITQTEKRTPADIGNATAKQGHADDAKLGHAHHMVALLKKEMAEVLLAPADGAVGPGLIKVGVCKQREKVVPLGFGSLVNERLKVEAGRWRDGGKHQNEG